VLEPVASLSAATLGDETREIAAAAARDEIHLIEVLIEAVLVVNDTSKRCGDSQNSFTLEH
jgi:hypothetical protein